MADKIGVFPLVDLGDPSDSNCDANADWIMTPEQRREEMAILDALLEEHGEPAEGNEP